MIQQIEIYNFRCYEKNKKFPAFNRVNLIGGKNNAGKTAFLEAMYLSNAPSPNSIFFLLRLRRENSDFLKAVPEKAWDNFFYHQNNREVVRIISKASEKTLTLELSSDDSVEEFARIEENIQEDNDLIDMRSLLINRDATRSVLHLNLMINGQLQPASSILANSKGVIGRELKAPDIKKVSFIPAAFRLSSSALAEEFDKAELNNKAGEVLEALRFVDNSIDQAKTLSIGEPALYLKRKNDSFMLISLFGEAISKVADFTLRLVNNRESILLIDEIENGFHHTNQHNLWRMLFKLALELDVQIFATTHSLEMLQAFAEIGQEKDFEGVGAYFEFARNPKTNQIVGIKRDIETLDFSLKRHKEVRGE
ncbi:MAG: ATP-binding protein [Anaerolineales bacterium]|nr:ATP-binding protein [Anaerolineales bacterium]